MARQNGGINSGSNSGIHTGVARLIVLVMLTVGSLPVTQAEPANARAFKGQFAYLPGCNACHQDGGGSPLNAYGKQFQEAGASLASFAKIADADADGDGASNAEEAQARANPGDAKSTPQQPGAWLDLGNLIPREVQQAFPQVRQYKPIDAILTDREHDRARAWGVDLTAEEDNTIYVPVQERKPIGTAVIIKGMAAEEAFYLLVTTDRQLALSGIQPIAGDVLPPAGDALYQQWRGVTAAAFANKPATGPDGAVAEAVHRALALIEARLKP